MQQVDDPPYLNVGTEVSAKYKGAFCEAKVRKVVRNIKCKVAYKQGLGSGTVSDDQIKGGTLRVGATVEVKHPDRREFVEATITKIQDCSQYTVVFDDGDITTLRRSALCLKSGRHFNESETLDQLPLTHPEHFGNPVIGGRRGRRSRQMPDDSSDEEEDQEQTTKIKNEKEEHIGKVVCVEGTETKKKGPKENWFPGLVVAPTAQVTVRIRVKDEYLVRSFKDGRYYTVPKKEANEFTRELAHKQEGLAVQAALEYLDNDVLPPHWDRDALFGLSASSSDYDQELDSDSSDDEPREEKDHFVAQLYKYMDDRGTPLNKAPSIINKDVDLYRLFRAVQKLGGYNRVTNQNQWKSIASRLGFAPATTSITNLVKQAYKKFLQPFEDFNRKLGCTMVAHPRANRIKGRSLLRANSVASPKPNDPKEGKSSLAADESADNSESSSTETSKRPELSKRKLSTSSGKVKALVDKFEEKIKEEPVVIGPIVSEPEIPPATVLTPLSIPSPTRVSSPSPTTVVSPTPSILPIPPVVKQYPRSAKLIKEETIPIPMLPTTISLPSSKKQQIRKVDEKRGRKKKEPEPEKVETKMDGKDAIEVSTDFPIEVGDKLKVLYHEQKVTYEAKVIEISKQDEIPVYLVHYTGWNTRYDEWVRKERIAENLTNSKAKRAKPPTKSGSNSSSSSTSSNCSNSINTTTTTPINKSSAKRGRGGSRSDSQPPRSTTPSSIASNSSRTKSPATPAQRRTTRGQPNSARRTSNNTDISSIQTDSDTDSDEPVKKPTPKPNLSGSKGPGTGGSLNTTPTSSLGNKSLPHHDDELQIGAKGRDYDLNQIRSELKGFKEIKSPSPDSDTPLASSIGIELKTETFDESDKLIKIESPSSKKLSEIIKSNTSSSEAKTSSDISSESDSFDGEDDSQSSSKLLSTIAMFTSEKTDKLPSELSEKPPSVAGKSSSDKNAGKLIPQSTDCSIVKQEKNLKEIQSEKAQSGKLADKVSGKSFVPTEKLPFKCQKDGDKFIEQKSPIKLGSDVPILKPSVKPNIPEKIIPIKVEKTNVAKKSNIASTEKIIKSGANEKLSKIIGLTEKNSFKSIAALQDKQLLTASSISLKETLKQSSLQSAASDVYEFKEPEPFEFESTSGRKPVPSTSINISPENEKKNKKSTSSRLEAETSINELKPSVSGTSPGPTKKNKKVPSKDFEHIAKTKVIKKEEKPLDDKTIVPIAAAAISQTVPVPVPCTQPFIMLVPNKTESAFDVLRKSPNFNIQNFGSCDEAAPDGTVKPIAFAPDEKLYESVNLLTTKPLPAFANPLADCSSSSNSSSIINSSSSNSNKIAITGTITGTELTTIKEEILPKIFELMPTVDSNNDSKGKDENPIKELETVKKILLSNTDFDLEPPKIEKPSIADKVLKALNQQQQQQLSPPQILQPQTLPQTQPPETRVKIENTSITSSNRISPTVTEEPTSIKLIQPFEPLKIINIGSPPMQIHQQPPKIEIPLLPIIKKDVSLELITRKPMLSSPEHKLDILESIAPKNNDLSETIQKLESAIQKASNIERFSQDSSDSTDSDQRLVIEDESQSSETNQAQTEFIAINKKDTDVSYGARKDLTKDKVFSKTTVKEDSSLTFSSRFQENAFNVYQDVIATPLPTAVTIESTVSVPSITTATTTITPKFLISNAQEKLPKLFNVDIKKDLTPSPPPPLKIELPNIDDNEIDVQLKVEKEDITNPQTITSESAHNNETISLLLCEETIPGSPAPACGNIKEVSEILKKGFEMSSTVPSSSAYSNPHPTTADIKPVPMDIENDTNPTSTSSPDTTSTVSQTQETSTTTATSTTTTTTSTGASLPTATTTSTAATTSATVVTTTVNTGKPQDKTEPGCTSNSSPRDSISQDESKSDSEDLKHQDNDPEISPKKRRRPRKSSECDNPNNSKRRKTTRQKATNAPSSSNNGGNGSDSDENSDTIHTSHRSSNAGRSGKPCQYNFLVQLDPALNSNQRIAILKKKIQDLRKTYNTIKAELASIDRRRKKLRRREREIKRNANKVNNS